MQLYLGAAKSQERIDEFQRMETSLTSGSILQ